MSQGHLHAVVRHLRRLAGDGAAAPSDRELLRRFAARRDQAAFTALVERHGPMVWGVCRRALRHEQDAEDVFQATFLVLARKADALPWRDSVHNWLYEVASRLAAECRARAARRRHHEEQAGRARAEALPPDAGRELAAVLDEELALLPGRYRAPLLLCYLEGQTGDQAARHLGWSLRTVQRRLAQGRDLLRNRLTRRGITLSAALLGPALADGATPSALLTVTTARAAVAFAAGAGGADLPAVTLAQTALRGMAMTRWKVAALVLLLVGTVAGTGVVVRCTAAPAPPEPEARAPVPKDPPAQKKDTPAPKPAPSPLSHRLWAAIELVREKHPEPPPRADMVAAAVKEVLTTAKVPVPDDLGPRARGIETEEQLAAFLKEVWPRGSEAPAQDLESAALNGIFAAVPGMGVFSSPEEARVADQVSGNRYVGTGIQIRLHPEEKYPQIVVPFRGGPAQRAGIRADDLILEADGKSLHEQPITKVVEMLRGEEGTTVTVVVRAPGSTEKRTVKITRSVVPFEHVMGYRRATEDAWDYLIKSNLPISYVRVTGCSSSTPQELRQVERRLRSQGARALVLDLRSGGGGSEFHNGILLGDALLDGAVLWRLRGADKQVREFKSGRDCLFRDWPMVVLVNDSIDTTEGAVVAALQDNGRAVLVGEPTRVGGYVNGSFQMPDGEGALTFRTGRLERVAKGRGWPVEPDNVVTLTKKQREVIDTWLREKTRPPEPGSAADKAPEDPQLAKAIEILRAALKKDQ
ncbi:MAG TPA: sigma-70 family RNA polymerase sigma factor [Gemmataceae bacterium]|nr:sigma-70 family RNA polymerase sigma factor [Gemmataceae bacterium]